MGELFGGTYAASHPRVPRHADEDPTRRGARLEVNHAATRRITLLGAGDQLASMKRGKQGQEGGRRAQTRRQSQMQDGKVSVGLLPR